MWIVILVETAEPLWNVPVKCPLLFSSSLLHSVDQDIHSSVHRSLHRTNSITHDMDISLDSPDEGQEKTHITPADILGTLRVDAFPQRTVVRFLPRQRRSPCRLL